MKLTLDKINKGDVHIIKTKYTNTLPKKFAIYMGTYYASLISTILIVNILIILCFGIGIGNVFKFANSVGIFNKEIDIAENIMNFNNILYPLTFLFIGIYISVDDKIRDSLEVTKFQEIKDNSKNIDVIKLSKVFSFTYITFLFMTVVQLILDNSISKYILVLPLIYFMRYLFKGIHNIKDCKKNYKAIIIVINLIIVGVFSYFFKNMYEIKTLLPSWLCVIIGLIFLLIGKVKTSSFLNSLFVINKDFTTHVYPLECYISPTAKEMLRKAATIASLDKAGITEESINMKKEKNKKNNYLKEEAIIGKKLRQEHLDSFKNYSRPEYEYISKRKEIEETRRIFELDDSPKNVKLDNEKANEIKRFIEEETDNYTENAKTDVSVDRMNAKR